MRLLNKVKRGFMPTLFILIMAFVIVLLVVGLWHIHPLVSILAFFAIAYFVGTDPWDE
jgi:hypothetical protein